MRIAVNARMLTQRKPGGIKNYAHETLKRITSRHREHEFLFIVDRPFPGRAERLRKIYGAAHALMFVSYFEGFGLPALEAMGCEVPVVCGDRTSLPEICGDAALFVDPFSVDAIAGAMKSICFDETLRKNLNEKGKTRKKFFHWDKTADLLWEAVERSLP